MVIFITAAMRTSNPAIFIALTVKRWCKTPVSVGIFKHRINLNHRD
jgi:hypothetical protein